MPSKLSLIGLTMGIVAVVGGLAWQFHRQIDEMKEVQRKESINHTETKLFLLSTIDWSSQRQKTILYMKDVMTREWERVGIKIDYEKAYRKAEAIMVESEKYPDLQPLFLMAIQRCESSFMDSLVSPAGAIGPWQLMPSTARLLCESLNLSYNPKYLYDPIWSTKLACRLIGVLYANYSNDEQVIADYNGGPWQAYYLVSDKGKMATETVKFLSCVKAQRDEYVKEFTVYKVDEKLMRGKR